MRGCYRDALRHRDLRLLIALFLVDQVGSWSYAVVISVYIFDRTHSTQWLAASAVCRWGPGLLLACWARIHDRGGDLLSSCSSMGLSGGDLVLVGESAEDLFPADPVVGEVDLRRPGVGLSRCELAEGPVRPGLVLVPQVFGQGLAQVLFVDDQQPVEEFAA